MSIIIRTLNKDEYKKLMKFLKSKGICWKSGDDATELNYYPLYGVLLDEYVEDVYRITCVKRPEDADNHQDAEVVTVEEYIRRNKDMTKSDLKNWMIVKTRIGNIYMVDNTHGILVSTKGWLQLADYSNDLLCDNNNEFDIVAVYKITYPFAVRFYMNGVYNESEYEYLQTIWEREEAQIEMTVAEIEKQLGIKNLKIIKEK